MKTKWQKPILQTYNIKSLMDNIIAYATSWNNPCLNGPFGHQTPPNPPGNAPGNPPSSGCTSFPNNTIGCTWCLRTQNGNFSEIVDAG